MEFQISRYFEIEISRLLTNRPVSFSQLPLITMTIDSFYSTSLDLNLNIHKFQSGYELFATLCILGDSNLAGIYEYLTSRRGSCCKNEPIVILISGNWEYETGLFGQLRFPREE